jgi:hypothetical protein
MDVATLRSRVDALLNSVSANKTIDLQNELYHGTLGIMQALYGIDSSQEKDLRTYLQRLCKENPPYNTSIIFHSISAINGALSAIKTELDSGFIGTLHARLTGETLTDFIKLARAVLDDSDDDAKNVGAVLTAAAFEDTLRRLADLKGCKDTEKLSDVLIWLKENGALQGSEVGIAQSYLNFRNKALHAKWKDVDRPAIESVLAFTEQIILKNLS